MRPGSTKLALMAGTLTLTVVLPLAAQEPAKPADGASAIDSAEDRAFLKLVDQAKVDPAKADYQRLREAFARTRWYRPEPEPMDISAVEYEMKNGERAAALVALDRLLEGRWANPEAHVYASSVFSEMGYAQPAALHDAFFRGLSAAILASGDGRGPQTAWRIVHVSEVTMILRVLGVQADGKPTRVERDGHIYDVVRVRDPRIGRDLTLYFNMDIPARWAEHSGKSDDPKAR
jgi:hypothetical protein